MTPKHMPTPKPGHLPQGMKKVAFPKNQRGKIKLLPCVCGAKHPQEKGNEIHCRECGRFIRKPYQDIRHRRGNPRYDWNITMICAAWRINKPLYWALANKECWPWTQTLPPQLNDPRGTASMCMISTPVAADPALQDMLKVYEEMKKDRRFKTIADEEPVLIVARDDFDKMKEMGTIREDAEGTMRAVEGQMLGAPVIVSDIKFEGLDDG